MLILCLSFLLSIVPVFPLVPVVATIDRFYYRSCLLTTRIVSKIRPDSKTRPGKLEIVLGRAVLVVVLLGLNVVDLGGDLDAGELVDLHGNLDDGELVEDRYSCG